MGKQTHPSNGQAEISVFAINIKGDSTVVTNALNTLAKQGVAFQPSLPTPKPPMVALSAPDPQQPTVDAPEVRQEAVEPEAKPARKRSAAPPKIVESIRAHEAPVPFKEFVGTRNFSTNIDKTVAIATWLRDHRQVEKFGVNELYTCFRMMDWSVPVDPGQPLRNAANTNCQCLRFEGNGLYSLTTHGMKKYDEIG